MNCCANILPPKEIKIPAQCANLPQGQSPALLRKHVPFPCRFILLFVELALTPSSDVLRRRFQINTMSRMGYQYKSIFDAVRVIIAEEGIRGMYKGIVPNLLKVAPSMASSWLSFEMTRDFLLSLRADAPGL